MSSVPQNTPADPAAHQGADALIAEARSYARNAPRWRTPDNQEAETAGVQLIVRLADALERAALASPSPAPTGESRHALTVKERSLLRSVVPTMDDERFGAVVDVVEMIVEDEVGRVRPGRSEASPDGEGAA